MNPIVYHIFVRTPHASGMFGEVQKRLSLLGFQPGFDTAAPRSLDPRWNSPDSTRLGPCQIRGHPPGIFSPKSQSPFRSCSFEGGQPGLPGDRLEAGAPLGGGLELRGCSVPTGSQSSHVSVFGRSRLPAASQRLKANHATRQSGLDGPSVRRPSASCGWMPWAPEGAQGIVF